MTTQLQQEMLKKIARSEYTPMNGCEPETYLDTETWSNAVLETAQDNGVFTSLLNANLVQHSGEGRYATVWLTEECFKEYEAIFKVLKIK